MSPFASVADYIGRFRPPDPFYGRRLHAVEDAAADFVAAFDGEVAYAVKCNPAPDVMAAIARSGIRAWDVASIDEVDLALQADPALPILFMNPVKPYEQVVEAYRRGVREFAVDHHDEIEKIVRACGGDLEMTLTVRVAVGCDGALMDLSGKFGSDRELSVSLLRRIRSLGFRCGLTFHVGSQCLDAEAHGRAVDLCAELVREADVAPVVIDVGGGFPARYAGDEADVRRFCAGVTAARERAGLRDVPFRCEPGRALAAPAASVVARVEAARPRRGLAFLNEGIYGALSELKYLKSSFPARAFRPDGSPAEGDPTPWAFAGPTCDSADMMPGPFMLPPLETGDYVEFGLMGAYSNSLATRFNGFGAQRWIDCADAADWRRTTDGNVPCR